MTTAQILALPTQTNTRLIKSSDDGFFYAIEYGESGADAVKIVNMDQLDGKVGYEVQTPTEAEQEIARENINAVSADDAAIVDGDGNLLVSRLTPRAVDLADIGTFVPASGEIISINITNHPKMVAIGDGVTLTKDLDFAVVTKFSALQTEASRNQTTALDSFQIGVGNTQAGSRNTQIGSGNNQIGNASTQSGKINTQSGSNNTQSGYVNNQSGSDNTQSGYNNTQSGYDNTQSGYNNTQSGYYGNQSGSSQNDGGFHHTFMFGSSAKTASVGNAAYFWVDNGIRIKPIAGDPSTLENGTIWITTGGALKFRANGLTKTVTAT